MTYAETIEFLFSQLPTYHRVGKVAYKNDLVNIESLDNYFNNPHLNFQSVHIAGTNGKGSVSHMLASVLQEAGYKTGLFTSPHLKDFRERIRVNGNMISESEVVNFVNEHRSIIDSVKPSFFEMSVAMAFKYFADCKVDVAIIEVGLGGRLDSTNIIKPVLSIITNIGHDHMDILGNTLEKVAAEKAGIIKKKVPVIISETQKETEEIFREKARSSESDILFGDKTFLCELGASGDDIGERNYLITNKITGKIIEGKTRLSGDYQEKNIQAVFTALLSLKNIFTFSDLNATRGIRNVKENTGLSGRWQILSKAPLTICDTGHNKEGLEYVVRQLKNISKSDLHMIIGFVNDKDLDSILPLFPQEAIYYFTKASIPRALDEKILKNAAEKYDLHGDSYPDVKTALDEARKKVSHSDVIFIGGSTFVVAEVIS